MSITMTIGSILKKSATALAIAGMTVSTAMASTALRLAHNLNQEHSVHQTFEYMNDQLQDLSGGKMCIRISPSNQMGDGPETLQMLQTGALDMTKGSGSDLEAFEKAYAVFNQSGEKKAEHWLRFLRLQKIKLPVEPVAKYLPQQTHHSEPFQQSALLNISFRHTQPQYWYRQISGNWSYQTLCSG